MIYFDAGATTLQKPDAVRRAMYQAVNTLSSPGRGSYPATRRAEETDLRCRMAAAELFHMDDPAQVVFTSCATHGLNIAIRTLVKPGSRVVISGYEHNAVTRPLHAIPNVEIVVADGPLFDTAAMLEQFRQALDRPADAVICTHVSNVFGYALPVEDIAALCRKKGVPFVLDASQSAGMLPVDMKALGASFIAMPGHKGLYGPQGTGLLLCGCETERGRSPFCRRCPPSCRTGWRRGRTICPASPDCWRGCGSCSVRAWHVSRTTRVSWVATPPGIWRSCPAWGCSPARFRPAWSASARRAWTARSWARRWRPGALRCGRDCTARRWPTGRRERWRPARCGSARRCSTGGRR